MNEVTIINEYKKKKYTLSSHDHLEKEEKKIKKERKKEKRKKKQFHALNGTFISSVGFPFPSRRILFFFFWPIIPYTYTNSESRYTTLRKNLRYNVYIFNLNRFFFLFSVSSFKRIRSFDRRNKKRSRTKCFFFFLFFSFFFLSLSDY